MANKQISSLPAAPSLDAASLFVCEQQGEAMKVTGQQVINFAQDSVAPQATAAANAAKQAAASATAAATSASGALQSAATAETAAANAEGSAQTAQQYSGNPAQPIDGEWWIWNAATGEYENSGQPSRGDVMYATFEINPATGILSMTTPDAYSGPEFAIVDGYLEVSISA